MVARPLLDSPVSRWGCQALRLLPLVALLMAPGQTCPSKCRCLAQDKVVLCNSRNLTAVPGKIPPDSELLDLSRNTLRTLHQGMFTRLQALKELDLSHNLISNIEHGAFNRLQKLMILQLKGNNLKMVPDGVFTELPNLSVLDISANQILLFLDHSFRDLTNLRKLETGDNHLVFISGQAFGGLQRLEQLTLEKCNLTSIPTEALSHLHQLVELRLKVLKVSTIPNHSFRKLHHLKVLEIHRWPFLTTLEPHSLSGLNLTSLYITKCNLRNVPYKAIKTLPHLRVLDLSYNPISVIHGRKLVELSHLREFHLTGGRLSTIQTEAFQGLIHFRLLNITGNDLQTLEKGIFHSVGNLEVLRLDRNPLVCDCRILWIFQRRRRLNFESHQPICATNSTREEKVFHKFSDVPRDHFTCTKPKIKDKSPQRVNVNEGEQANLTCRSDGDPLPILSWVSPQNLTLDTRRKGRITVLPDGTLKIRYALPGDSGSYLCIASNVAGNDTLVAELHVSALLFNDSFIGNSLRFLNETQSSYLLLVGAGTLVGILALGIVPFLCSVALCFVFISLWSKGRGNVKHHVVDSVPRVSRGYKAFSSPHKAEAKGPR